MGPPKAKLEHTRSGISGETSWETEALSLTVERVCRACNHGWMKRLEDAAAPILTPLMANATMPLTPEMQRRIASWTAKTAAMFAFAVSPPKPLPEWWL